MASNSTFRGNVSGILKEEKMKIESPYSQILKNIRWYFEIHGNTSRKPAKLPENRPSPLLLGVAVDYLYSPSFIDFKPQCFSIRLKSLSLWRRGMSYSIATEAIRQSRDFRIVIPLRRRDR